jgi:ribosome-binding protein aMBF1 (putative translation factor)
MGKMAGMKSASQTSSEFNAGFIARVRELREARGLSQQDAADSLQIPFERYRKYEQGTMMPHRLIQPFIFMVDGDLNYLMTGHKSSKLRRA